MKTFDSQQKIFIKDIIKVGIPSEVDLTAVIVKYLPEDFFIGGTRDELVIPDYCIWYKPNQSEFVQGVLSLKISSFISLIQELVRNDYLIKVGSSLIAKSLAIGRKPIDYNNVMGYKLGSNLTYDLMIDFFGSSKYFTTEKLLNLPKHNYMELNDYATYKQLKYTRWTVGIAAAALVLDIILRVLEFYIQPLLHT